LTTGAAEVATVTGAEATLVHLPKAVAFAVTLFPEASALSPLLVHAPPLTVVVPFETRLTNNSIVVPSFSLLLPLTLVAPTQIGELIAGAAEVATITAADAVLVHLPEAVALAVTLSPEASALSPFLVHAPPLTVEVPFETRLTNTSIVVPLFSLLVPLTLVAPTQMGGLTTGAAEVATITAADAALVHLPEAVALAVTLSPEASAPSPFLVHVPPLAVVVPFETRLTKTSTVVPSFSLLVPLTLTAPTQMGELTTGAAELASTVTGPEAELVHLPEAVALPVIIFPAVTAGLTVALQAPPPPTEVLPTRVGPSYTAMAVPMASVLVPLTVVAPSQIGVLSSGAAEMLSTVTLPEAGLTHLPGAVAVAVIELPVVTAGLTVALQL
jgi:hypothetical protein